MVEVVPAAEQLQQFMASGRSGRRNAMPEIDIQCVDPGAQKLAEKLAELCTEDIEHENLEGNDTSGKHERSTAAQSMQ